MRNHRYLSDRRAILLLSLLAMISITACNRSSGPPGGRRPQRQDIIVPVVTETVAFRDLTEYLTVTGRLEGITDITMLSETSGRVLTVNKRLGERVEAGEELGTIDNEVFRIRLEQAKAGLAAAEAALETASMHYRSTKQLLDNGSVSQAEYQQARFSHQGSIAQRDGAAAGFESAQKAFKDSQLIAPVSGYISSLNLKVGETIFPNVPLVGIVNSSKLLLKGGIAENHILAVKKGQDTVVFYKDKNYPAKVHGLGVKPVPNTSNYPIEIIIDNPGGDLMPGMVVTASIRTNVHRNVIYTESGTIGVSYDDTFVYTVSDELQAVRTLIVPGRTVNQFTIVKEGLKPGDKIVVQGQDSLENGMSVNIRQ